MRGKSGVGQSTIDGSTCLPILWSRFSSELTTKTGGGKLYRDLIVNNHVSCSIAGPTTHRDVIATIAQKSEKIIPVESLADTPVTLPRGKVVFGFPGNYFDQLARNYDGMQWWISHRGLNMQILKSATSNLSPFDELAGKLVYEAWLRRLPNGRITATEYGNIFAALDEAGFRPLDYLKGEFRKKLAARNQKNPTKPIHTFCQLSKSNIALPRRGMLKRLHRAKSAWIKANILSEI